MAFRPVPLTTDKTGEVYMDIDEIADRHNREQAEFENDARIRRLLAQYLQYVLDTKVPCTRKEGFPFKTRAWVVFNSDVTSGHDCGPTRSGAIVYETGRVVYFNTNYEQIWREITKMLVPGKPWPYES